uniref:SURF1-like protein n=1 Tax=Heterorhabditis bacteriophora TaxID=37862 RepID=A0A1I7XGP2_HETBA
MIWDLRGEERNRNRKQSGLLDQSPCCVFPWIPLNFLLTTFLLSKIWSTRESASLVNFFTTGNLKLALEVDLIVRPQFVQQNIPEKDIWFYKDFHQMSERYGTEPIFVDAVIESTIPGGPIGGQTNINVKNDHLSYIITWENWLDPNDPSVGRVSYMGAGNRHEFNRMECKVGISDDPTLRLILRDLFAKLKVDPLQKTHFSQKARLSLSSYNMDVISSYLESNEHENELALREKVRTALKNMVEILDDDDYLSTWDSVYSILQPWISLLNMVVLPEKIAARLAAAALIQGDACAPGGLFQQSLEFMTNLIAFKKKSQCLTFVESQTVSVIAEISLMDVFSDVISNSVFGVLGSLGRHTNKFFRAFYDEVPLPAMLLMTITLIFTTVRISTPLFTFEPLLLSITGHLSRAMIQCVNGPCNQTPESLRGEERPAIMGSSSEGYYRHQSIQNSATNIAAITLNKGALVNGGKFPDPDSSPFVTKRTPERQKKMRRTHISGAESDGTGSRSSSLDSSYSRGQVSDAPDSRDGDDFLNL